MTRRAIAFWGILFAANVFAAPAQVIIIRHAEKPPSGNELDARGWQRAQALVGFFETNTSVTRYGTPAAIYAMNPKKPGGSVRAIQTVTPLAEDLGLEIQHPYTKHELGKVVDAILTNHDYDRRMVLVCWEHGVIPDLVKAFGWDRAPDTWEDPIYDRAWILNFSGDKVVSFEDIPQHLLPGDSAN